MNGSKKTIIIDGVPTELVEFQRGGRLMWAKEEHGLVHILPVKLWEGHSPRYRANSSVYELPGTVGKDQSLIQRIEYALHSRYDADNRQLLEEALALLKERA